MRAIIPQIESSGIALDAAWRPRLSPKWAWTDVISSNATNILFIPSAFLSRLMAAYYLLLCTSGLMKFTYKYHADTGLLCKWACFLACSSISPIYVARPGFTFKAGEQAARLLLIWPCFSSWPLIKSPALFAIQARGMALLLCSAVTCQFPALPDREIRPSEVEDREMWWKTRASPSFLFTPSVVFNYRNRFVP